MCPRCGLVFAKYRLRPSEPLPRKDARPANEATPASGNAQAGLARRIWNRLNEETGSVDGVVFGGRLLVFLVFLFWGLLFIATPMETNYVGSSFWHLVNLVFHEAGHLVFALFGPFLRVLGGSLMQIIIPALCAGAFVWHRNPFGAAMASWWTAQSFMDIAPYINDARAGKLMLLNGVTGRDAPQCHDWHNLLSRLGWLEHDQRIATVCYGLGIFIMSAALAWGAWILYNQFRFAPWADRLKRR